MYTGVLDDVWSGMTGARRRQEKAVEDVEAPKEDARLVGTNP